MESHAGSLTAQSAKNVGSVFSVRLPIAPAELAPVPEPKPAEPRRLRVLVVDDDQRVAHVIARCLADHDVTVAIGGFEALEFLERKTFDAVLSDVMMPDLDGPSLYEEVSIRWPELVDHFAFVTGAARGSSVARAVQEAGRRVFHKPLQARQLVDWLESLEFDNDPSSQA